MFHSYQWLPTGAGFLPSTVWLLVKLRSESGPKNHRRPGRFTNDANRLLMPQPYCTLCHGQNLDYTHAYIYIYMYIWSSVQTPLPPRPWFWVSHSTVPLPPLWCGVVPSAYPPCGVVGVWYCPLPLPVVWLGCGTAHIYICIYLFIYRYMCMNICICVHIYMYVMYVCMSVCMSVCLYVCMYVCIYMCVYT